MTSFGVANCHYVEEKRLDVVVESFVVQEKFGKKTQILTILLVTFPINFPDSDFIFSEMTKTKNLR